METGEVVMAAAELRMASYYFVFKKTGVLEIDRILSEVASAGEDFHHTRSWGDPLDYCDGKSHVNLIQDAANNAAMAMLEKQDLLEALKTCRDMLTGVPSEGAEFARRKVDAAIAKATGNG